MNKDNIFIAASEKNTPVEPDELKDLEVREAAQTLKKLIREFVLEECYGWPVEKEEHLYGVKASLKSPAKDPKNSLLKLPKGSTSRDKA